MSHVESPFIVSVIRSREKSLLGDNEITRIMHASSMEDAREVLMSTPYGLFLTEGVPLRTGLMNALEADFLWLKRSLDNKRVVEFIGARYDILHMARGIVALAKGEVHMPEISSIGVLSSDVLQAMIFTDSFEETNTTAFFLRHIEIQKNAIATNTWSMPFFFEEMQNALEERFEQLAFTPFMRALALHVKNRHASDGLFRTHDMQTDAARYEWEWDVQAIELARTMRFEPIGYDPIIAYWITKEMEIKTINLLFAALSGGFTKEETTALIRPFAHV